MVEEENKSTSGVVRVEFYCRCKCGEVVIRRAGGLKNGVSTQCRVCAHSKHPDMNRDDSYTYTRFLNRIKKYGLDEKAFRDIMDIQRGLCPLCDRTLHFVDGGGLHIDHCHESGKVRGLLCGDCNISLGFIERVTGKVDLMVSYIKKGGIV